MSISPRMMSNKVYLNDMFDDFLFSRFKNSTFERLKCDIYEKNNVYYLEMDIPGFDRDDINIEIDDNDYLTVTALKNTENTSEDDSRNYICKERNYDRYQRVFYLAGVDKENIDANFLNGILKITMPKKREEKSKIQKIQIK